MLSNRYVKWGGIFAILILANIISYIYWNWGLITVNVDDAPLGKVIKSIEWQGWVKIYSNIPPDTKVTVHFDKLPLAEAMENLAANVERPRDPNQAPPNEANRRPENAPAGATPGGRPPGGRGGFGGGGGGAQWNLAFFVGPSSAQVKAEIQAFQAGTTDEDIRVYTYPTPFQMVAGDEEMDAADPRLQTWPGYKAPPPPAAPADGTPAPEADTAAPTVQTYLKAFAQSSNIWIMAPASWAPAVAQAPPENSSIISAVKKLVSSSRGAVTQAIILRQGRGARGGPDGGNRGGGDYIAQMEMTADRLRNAIRGLPPEARADANERLDSEVAFFQEVRNAAPENQAKMVRDHMRDKMMANQNNSRRSPKGRAARYQRAVSNRQTAQGTK